MKGGCKTLLFFFILVIFESVGGDEGIYISVNTDTESGGLTSE